MNIIKILNKVSSELPNNSVIYFKRPIFVPIILKKFKRNYAVRIIMPQVEI